MRLCLMLLLLGLAGPLAASAAPSDQLCVMTFNVRYASATPPNAWPDRREVLRDCVRAAAPDLIGTQEGVYSQLKDISADLPEYEWIGTGRDGGSRGEFMAVFYRRDRLEPLAFDHFWLSDTPATIGSITWGPQFARMVTWVHFRDRASGREFHFWNTHFDHEVQPAREKSAALIRQRLAQLDDSRPILLVGDFNVPAQANPVYSALVEDGFLRDTWTLARERRNEDHGTFHGFGENPQGGARIDWILVRGEVEVPLTEIVTCQRKGQYPSDHYPVVARLRWLEAPSARR